VATFAMLIVQATKRIYQPFRGAWEPQGLRPLYKPVTAPTTKLFFTRVRW